MLFDPENKIIRICAQGMEMEHSKQLEKAKEYFNIAWDQSKSNIEKFVSAHYLARHQSTTEEKLQIDDPAMNDSFASLYLNTGRGFEDLGDIENAMKDYKAAASFVQYLPDNSYGSLIKEGIQNALDRLQTVKITIL